MKVRISLFIVVLCILFAQQKLFAPFVSRGFAVFSGAARGGVLGGISAGASWNIANNNIRFGGGGGGGAARGYSQTGAPRKLHPWETTDSEGIITQQNWGSKYFEFINKSGIAPIEITIKETVQASSEWIGFDAYIYNGMFFHKPGEPARVVGLNYQFGNMETLTLERTEGDVIKKDIIYVGIHMPETTPKKVEFTNPDGRKVMIKTYEQPSLREGYRYEVKKGYGITGYFQVNKIE